MEEICSGICGWKQLDAEDLTRPDPIRSDPTQISLSNYIWNTAAVQISQQYLTINKV